MYLELGTFSAHISASYKPFVFLSILTLYIILSPGLSVLWLLPISALFADTILLGVFDIGLGVKMFLTDILKSPKTLILHNFKWHKVFSLWV